MNCGNITSKSVNTKLGVGTLQWTLTSGVSRVNCLFTVDALDAMESPGY